MKLFSSPIATITEHAHSTKNFFTTTYSQLKEVSSYAYSFVSASWIKETIGQGWQGYSTPLNMGVVSQLVDNKDVRQVCSASIRANIILYLGKVLLYQLSKNMMQTLYPPYENSYPEMILDTSATFILLNDAMQMFVYNPLYNTSMSRAVKNKYSDKPYFPGCGHHSTEKIQANCNSPFYYIGYIATAKFAENALPLGWYVGLGLRTLAYGQALVEYNLNDYCGRDRAKLFAMNNAYAMGLGLSFMSAVFASTEAIKYCTGANNYFVYDVCFSLAFQYYVLAVCLPQKTLPGKVEGIDVFYYSRLVTEAIIKNVTEDILNRFKHSQTEVDWLKIKNKIQQFPPYNLVVRTLLPKEILSVRRFVRTEPAQLFLGLYGDEIHSSLKKLIDLRKDPVIYYVSNYGAKFLLSKETAKYLKIILAKYFEGGV